MSVDESNFDARNLRDAATGGYPGINGRSDTSKKVKLSL
jgi:hypothetical protein